MKKNFTTDNRRSLLIALVAFGLIASFAFTPSLFHSAAGNVEESAQPQTKSQSERLADYDIRTDKAAAETLLSFRQTAGRDAVENADTRDKFVAAGERLRQSVPTLKIEYSTLR